MQDLSTIDARRSLAAKYAAKYNLPTDLVCALIEQESSWNPWSMRYEPAFYARYIDPMLQGLTISETEAKARATSYGLCQVLGQVARELGFKGKFLSELCDPDVGVDYGCKKLRACLDANHGNESVALQRYNGGAAPNYSAEVQARRQNYV